MTLRYGSLGTPAASVPIEAVLALAIRTACEAWQDEGNDASYQIAPRAALHLASHQKPDPSTQDVNTNIRAVASTWESQSRDLVITSSPSRSCCRTSANTCRTCRSIHHLIIHLAISTPPISTPSLSHSHLALSPLSLM